MSSGSRRQSVAERIRGQRDDELYPSLTSKLHCMLEQGAIITYTKDRSIADEIALEREWLSVAVTLSLKKSMMGVPKGTIMRVPRDHRIRGEKSSFEG